MPRLLPFITLLLILLSGSTAAQEYGAVLRGGIGASTGITRDSGVVNIFGAAGTGESRRVTVGLGFALRTPWLLLDLAPTYTSESFLSDPYVVGDSASILSQRQFLFDATSLDLELAARYRFTLNEQWEIAAGGWMGYRLLRSATVREQIIAPDSISFADGTRERIVSSSSITRSRWRGGTAVEFAYSATAELRLTIPEIRIDGGALLAGDNITRVFSVGAGAAVLFGSFSSSPSETTPPPPPPRDTTPPLQISLSMIAEGPIPTPALARAERERVQMIVPWPMITGFAPGSSTVPSRYLHNAHGRGTPFTVGSLAQQPPDTVAGYALDLLRFRHNAHPDAIIRIVGHATNNDGEKLARARAESVRRYLVQSARIAPSVLKVESVVDNIGESVEIVSENAEIAEPIVVEWGVRRLRAPTLLITPSVNRKGATQSWELRVERSGRELLAMEGTDELPMRGWSRRLPLYNLLDPEPLPPLVATLQLTDTSGVDHRASATLPVGVARELDTVGYTLQTVVLHLPNSATLTTPGNVDRALRLAASLAGEDPLVRGDRTVRDALARLLTRNGTVNIDEAEISEEYQSAGWRSATLRTEARSEK